MSWFSNLCHRVFSHVATAFSSKTEQPHQQHPTHNATPAQSDPLSPNPPSQPTPSPRTRLTYIYPTSRRSSSATHKRRSKYLPSSNHQQQQHQHQHQHHPHDSSHPSAQPVQPRKSRAGSGTPTATTTATASNNSAIATSPVRLSSPRFLASLRASSRRSPRNDKFDLLALPDDVLLLIFRFATHCPHHPRSPPVLHVVEQRSFHASAALALVSRRTSALFFASLDNICLASSPVSDPAVHALSRRAGPSLRRLVLRGSHGITDASLRAIARHAPRLRSLDLSFLPLVSADGLAPLCAALRDSLRLLLLRKCTQVDDEVLHSIAQCPNLETLDISHCGRVSDHGMAALVAGAGPALRLLAFAHNALLTDKALAAVGEHCSQLMQLCARGLPLVTNRGFEQLCAGVGEHVEGIDVTLCPSLTREETLSTLDRYCDKIYVDREAQVSSRSLQQIIISTLMHNIFIVHGSDPLTKQDTVHTVLIDNGDLVSASVLTSGTTDLSMLGIVLHRSFGTSLDKDTKQKLHKYYGIPQGAL